jgi:hypothetical protein
MAAGGMSVVGLPRVVPFVSVTSAVTATLPDGSVVPAKRQASASDRSPVPSIIAAMEVRSSPRIDPRYHTQQPNPSAEVRSQPPGSFEIGYIILRSRRHSRGMPPRIVQGRGFEASLRHPWPFPRLGDAQAKASPCGSRHVEGQKGWLARPPAPLHPPAVLGRWPRTILNSSSGDPPYRPVIGIAVLKIGARKLHVSTGGAFAHRDVGLQPWPHTCHVRPGTWPRTAPGLPRSPPLRGRSA